MERRCWASESWMAEPDGTGSPAVLAAECGAPCAASIRKNTVTLTGKISEESPEICRDPAIQAEKKVQEVVLWKSVPCRKTRRTYRSRLFPRRMRLQPRTGS